MKVSLACKRKMKTRCAGLGQRLRGKNKGTNERGISKEELEILMTDGRSGFEGGGIKDRQLSG